MTAKRQRAVTDPMAGPEYEKFLADTAKRCRSRHAPCGGCLAGGMCDNFDGFEGGDDDCRVEYDHFEDEEDWL